MIGSCRSINFAEDGPQMEIQQVGPAIAGHVTIPHAAWVPEIMDINEKSIRGPVRIL